LRGRRGDTSKKEDAELKRRVSSGARVTHLEPMPLINVEAQSTKKTHLSSGGRCEVQKKGNILW